MEFQEYLDKKKEIQEHLLDFLDSEEDSHEKYEELTKLFHQQRMKHNPHELKLVLHLLLNIANNHHRNPRFFHKIERILHTFKKKIKRHFTNYEIFNIFKSNKRILLFLFEKDILTMDKSIVFTILTTDKFKDEYYPQYFYPEIQPFVDESVIKQISQEVNENFEEKRKAGENDNHFCEIIRNDDLKAFKKHVEKDNIHLSSKIEPSIYETNPYLMKKPPTLIEYSAFYGSSQIFKYIMSKMDKISSSVWFYAIHGKDPELIHKLKENHVKPKYKSFEGCLKESIKCHHNELVNFFNDSFSLKDKDNSVDVFLDCLKYYNFAFIQIDMNNTSLFYLLCKYDYIHLVNVLLEKKYQKKGSRMNVFVSSSIFF